MKTINLGIVEIKKITEDDIELIYYWRQNYEIYKYFMLQTGPLDWDDHIQFWNNYINRYDWIVFYDGRRVGSVYYKEVSSEVLDIGIYIADITLRGRGIASRAIRLALEWAISNQYQRITAYVHNDNSPSNKLFERNGFVLKETDKDSGFNFYIYDFNHES